MRLAARCESERATTTRRIFRAPHPTLRSLTSTIGDQNYMLPPGTGAGDIRSVVVVNAAQRLAYAAARLRADAPSARMRQAHDTAALPSRRSTRSSDMRTSTVTAIAVAVAAVLSSDPARAAAQAPAGAELLAPLARSTPVDEYGGWLLFSRWDGHSYRLSSWRDGELRDLQVRPQATPFDADLGPDSDGRPSVVVSLCDGSCDLFVSGLDVGDRLRPVRNANTTGRDEIAATVWKGRLAFGRRYGADRVVPYTKLLAWPRSRPSERLAGLPSRRCGAVDPPDCRRLEDTKLVAMELWGRWVAQHWTYQPDKFPGFRQNEIRLTSVGRTDTRQLAYMTTGLGGQTYLGPSISAGHVAFFRACQGDPGGCSTTNSGAIRYRSSTGRYEIDGAVQAWSGWAWSGATGYHVPSDFACAGGDPGIATEPCGIYRRRGLDWTPIRAERVR